MQWNLINLKCKIVPYTLLPILLPEASSVPSCLWSLCYMSSEPDKLNHIYQLGGTTTSNRNVERHITYCDNEERIPVK